MKKKFLRINDCDYINMDRIDYIRILQSEDENEELIDDYYVRFVTFDKYTFDSAQFLSFKEARNWLDEILKKINEPTQKNSK